MITEEMIYNARNVDLKQYFDSKGYKTEKENKGRYRISGFGGLIVHNCTYYRFSTNTEGNAIDCLVNEFGYSFKNAVLELLGHSFTTENHIIKIVESKPFEMPPLNKDQRRAFAYLNKTRKIDKELISWLLHNKLLFQDSEYNNCIFPFYDENKNIVGAEIIGTLDKKRFKKIGENSKLGYGFEFSKGTPNKACFFESAIDLLSFICLHKESDFINDTLFVSLGGLKKEIIYRIHRQIKDIYICVDNDIKVFKFITTLSHEIEFKTKFSFLKDWNDDLIEKQKKICT